MRARAQSSLPLANFPHFCFCVGSPRSSGNGGACACVISFELASVGSGDRAAHRTLPAGVRRRRRAAAEPPPHPAYPGALLQQRIVSQFEIGRAGANFCCIWAALWRIFQVFHPQQSKQGGAAVGPQPPAPRPKVRARRGQATDPHSIAERVIKSVPAVTLS